MWSKIISSVILTLGNKHKNSLLKLKGCQDTNFTIKLSLQTVCELGKSFYSYVDLVRFFNTVNREILLVVFEISETSKKWQNYPKMVQEHNN